MEQSIMKPVTNDLGIGSLSFTIQKDKHIENLVSDVKGYGTINGNEISYIYISEYRVCVELKNGTEFSIPIRGSVL